MRRFLSLILLSTGLGAGILRAQAPVATTSTPAAEALQGCLTLVEQNQVSEAQASARLAQALFQAQVDRQPTDVSSLVGLARVTSQCLLPAADFIKQGELSSEAIELLDRALEIDPKHWLARMVRASINYQSPEFLGRAPKAAADFDELLRQQGDRTDDPRFSRAYELRGMLWSKAGKSDSARAVWRRGAALFPSDTILRKLLETNPPSPAASPTSAAPSATALIAVRITAPVPSTLGSSSTRTVTKSEILMAPGGGADVLQSVQMQPGATRVAEGSDVYTRGGDPSETSLLVNGGRVLSLSRFETLSGGMFGALEPFVVRSVRYSSGGYTARHGNALSGVLEIETDGRPRERQLRAGVSLVQASGTARTAMGKHLGGWVSARVSNIATLLATHGRSAEFDGAPHSQEVIASMIATPSPMSELRATVIVEHDDARRIIDAAGWNGAFHAAGALEALQLSSRWMSSRAPVIVRASTALSRKSSDWDFGVLSRRLSERNAISRADVEWAASSSVTMRAGLEHGALARDDDGVLPTTSSVAPGSPTRVSSAGRASARHVGTYGEAELVRGVATLTIGLRADRLPGESETTMDPRLAVAVKRGAWGARLSSGIFHQGRFRPDAAIPDAGTPSGTARTARHLVAALEHEGSTMTWRAEGYLKRYADYAARGAGPQAERGQARGVDLIAQKNSGGRVTGWVGYSLLDATVTLADGRVVRSPFDITHAATASSTIALNSDWSIGSTVRYGTGAPLTPVLGAQRQPDGRLAPVHGPITSDRLPAYARIDARVMRFIRAPAFVLTTFVEVINAADRHNVAGVTYDSAYQVRRPVHSFFSRRTIVAGGEFQFR